MKFNIVIYTQVHENYGAHDWDGKGDKVFRVGLNGHKY